MKPYSTTTLGELYNYDVVDWLTTIPDEYATLGIVDPPYNINKAEWDVWETTEEYIDWCSNWVSELYRVLKPNGTMYIFGFAEILAHIYTRLTNEFAETKWLVWHYENKPNFEDYWGRSHESILHLRKGEKYTFNVDPVRVPYNEHTRKYPNRKDGKTSTFNSGDEYEWTPHPKGARPKDVITVSAVNNGSSETTEHPTQKPEELIAKLVLSSSNENDMIIDPMAGSGTTFSVCEQYNREWIGCEYKKEYCKMIKERLSNFNQQNRIYEYL